MRIRPESTGFRAEADREIRTALAGLNPEIKVGMSTAGVKQSARDLRAYVAALLQRNFAMRLVADDKQLQASLAKTFSELLTLQTTVTSHRLTLKGVAEAQAALLRLDAQGDAMSKKVTTLHIAMDNATAQQRLALLITQLTALASKSRDLKITVTDPGALDKITALQAAISGLHGIVTNIDLRSNIGDLTRVEGLVAQVTARLAAMAAASKAAANPPAPPGGWWGWLRYPIPLFGGIIKGALGTVAAWHLMLDVFIELAAVIIPAVVGILAWGAAAASTFQDVYTRVKAANTVFGATGQLVGPLTGAFQKVQDAVRPQVYQIYGDALKIINSRMGLFSTLAQGVGSILTTFAAKITNVLSSSTGNTFLRHAMQDVQGLGNVIGAVSGIVGVFLKVMPGFAQVFLNVAAAALGFLNVIAHMAAPILGLGIWIHGLWLYLGLAATGVIMLSRWLTVTLIPAISRAGAAMLTFLRTGGLLAALSNPVGWAVGATVVLGGLVYWLNRSKSSVQQTADQLQHKIDTSNWSNVQSHVINAVSGMNLALTGSQKTTSTWSKLTDFSLQHFKQALGLTGTQTDQARSALMKFNGEGQTMEFRLGQLTAKYGSASLALGYMNLAGVKASDIATANASQWAIDKTKIDGLVTGYAQMGVAAGQAGNGVMALFVAGSSELSNLQQLQGAWTTLLGIVAGGQSTFVTFAQDLLSVGEAAGGIGGTGRIVTATFAGAARSAANAGIDINGLNAASLQLQATWSTAITGANTYYQALQQQVTASGNGAAATALLARAGKDIIAQFIPAARTSDTMRNSVYLLAQEMGYHGVNSAKALADWVGPGKLQKRMQDLQSVNSQLAQSVSNVTRDFQALASTLATDVKDMLAQVSLGESGAAGAAKKLADDLRGGHTPAAVLKGDYDRLVTALHNAGLSWGDARNWAAAFTKGLGTNAQAINTNWQGISTLTGKLVASHTPTRTLARIVATELAPAAAAGALQNDRMRTSIYLMAQQAGYAGPNKIKPLNDWLNANKASSQQAKQWLDNLRWSMDQLNGKNVSATVQAHAIGQGLISFTEHGLPSNAQGYLQFHARGARIPGYGGGDTHPAMLEAGETVVPKHLTPMVAPLMAAHHVPGFAQGGYVGLPAFGNELSQIGANDTNNINWHLAKDENFVQAASHMFMNDAVAAVKASIAAALRAASSYGAHSGPGGGVPLQNALLARQIFPWGMNEWQSFQNLVMGESGFNQYAMNASSGAYGIAQALPPTKYPFAGQAAGGSNPTAQLTWMFGYIRSVYGDPNNAYSTWLSRNPHWYDTGGLLMPGLTMAYNGTSRPERIVPDSGGGGVVLEVHGTGPTGALDRAMLDWIRHNVRTKGGGDVQSAFGRNN